ncbi:MAG: sigma 54-interacting transcriptional regulator [Pseudomonadota bacterium]
MNDQVTEESIPILVVDDDRDLLELLSIRLRRAGFAVSVAESGNDALGVLRSQRQRAVVTDLKMDGMDGLELLGEIESTYPALPVIVLTAHGSIPDAVTATQQGAFAFLTKPLDTEELIQTLNRAVALSVSPEPFEAVVSSSSSDSDRSDSQSWRQPIVSRSAIMESTLQEAELAAASKASIIIQSESGTGKELLARAIHGASQRCEEPFVAVNCTAIPENLFESEMFGHKRGAFTGASRDRAGFFQRAHGGTLFLDEVGEMPLAFQAKLLRVLQEQAVEPLGSDSLVQVDVRVVSATHRNLEQEINAGNFREDLFYRLAVVTLKLPSLAQRREDIPLLAQHFLHEFRSDGVARSFSSAAIEHLLSADWPGNVRQLANVVQQCVVMGRSRVIPENLVVRALKGRQSRFAPLAEARDRFEFEYISRLLHTTEGNVAQAARLAQRNRSEFYKLLKKHHLDPAHYRPMA